MNDTRACVCVRVWACVCACGVARYQQRFGESLKDALGGIKVKVAALMLEVPGVLAQHAGVGPGGGHVRYVLGGGGGGAGGAGLGAGAHRRRDGS